MLLVILICIAVVVVVAVVFAIRGLRSRSAKSDWLGELSEIRRSSLGDDEEVTGALEAVTVVEEAPLEQPPDDGDEPNLELPIRTIEDAGSRFDEYEWPGVSRLRVDTTEPRGLRVLTVGDREDRQVVVDLPRGVLWFCADANTAARGCVVRSPAGWVSASGILLVVVTDDGWSYVMCLDGDATIRVAAGGERVVLGQGQIGRIRADTDDHDIVDVGVEALESEGVVRRQRRLDARQDAPTSARTRP